MNLRRRKRSNFDLCSCQSRLCYLFLSVAPTDLTHRRARVTIAEKEKIAQDTEEALRKKELEAEERRKQSHDLVAESIRRELAESTCPTLFYILIRTNFVNLQRKKKTKFQMSMIRMDWTQRLNSRHGDCANSEG